MSFLVISLWDLYRSHRKVIRVASVPRGEGETLLTLQICSGSKTMRQLSNPVCLRLEARRDRNKLRNKKPRRATSESKLCFYCARSEPPRPAHTLIVEALLFDVFNSWVCAAMFGGFLTSELVYCTEARMREEVTEEGKKKKTESGKVLKVTNTQINTNQRATGRM